MCERDIAHSSESPQDSNQGFVVRAILVLLTTSSPFDTFNTNNTVILLEAEADTLLLRNRPRSSIFSRAIRAL